NTYTGVVNINAGELNVQSNTALGSTTGGTAVASGATLMLSNGVTLPSGETFTGMTGTGFGGAGAIRSISGTHANGGTITLTGGTTIGVDAGQLTLAGVISQSGTQAVTKLLPGTLVYAGTSANTYTGTTSVNEGTLLLNKSAGVDAFQGQLTVSNDNGGPA